MSKYIIKNCPAYDYEEEFDYHICKQPLVPYECSVDDCKECTDCVMKQIYEKCKQHADNSSYCGHCSTENLGYSIIDLLQIEEVD